MSLEQVEPIVTVEELVPTTSLEQGDEVYTPQGYWQEVTGIFEYQLAFNGRLVGSAAQPWKVLHLQHASGGMVVFATSMIVRRRTVVAPCVET